MQEIVEAPSPVVGSRTLPPFWLILLTGWIPVAVGNGIAAMTVLGQKGQVLAHALFVLVYAGGTVPLGLLQRRLWRRGVSWQRSVFWLVPCSLLVALMSTAAGLWMMAWIAARPSLVTWRAVLGSMDAVWFVLLAFCAMTMVVGYYLSMQQEKLRALAANALARDAELRALRYQLHPHFLFNTLNAISTLVVERRSDEATRMIARLGDFLRATLEAGGAHEVALADELALTGHYLDIEKARLGDRLVVKTTVGPDTLRAAVPHLLLQPLVENAIRHGIAPRREGGRLEISIQRIDRRLHLHLRNDAPLAPPDAAAHGTASIGLRNVRERLQRLYEGDHRFTLGSTDDGGYEVRIELPYRLPSIEDAPEHPW